MRSVLCKCPNHQGCLTGYHRDDIEVTEGMAPVCPECGSPLRAIPRPQSALVPHLVNLVVVACFAAAIWLAWPTIKRYWNQFTAPSTPAKTK